MFLYIMLMFMYSNDFSFFFIFLEKLFFIWSILVLYIIGMFLSFLIEDIWDLNLMVSELSLFTMFFFVLVKSVLLMGTSFSMLLIIFFCYYGIYYYDAVSFG